MLGNCKKTVPSTTRPNNKWTQSQIDDHNNKEWMASSGSGNNRVMEKPGEELLQQQQQALRCPRCDSSNTKFCYYNNYSLSQPRHFCKACKRYWTRGGTLRNVPVGGGCRKNKRVKRPTSSKSNIDTTKTVDSPSSSNNSNPLSQPQPQPQLQHLNNINNNNNSLVYGSCDVMNLQFPTRFVNSNSSRYDFQVPPHISALGLGFSSGILGSDDGYRNGFGSNNALFPSYNSIFGGSTTSTSASMPSSTPVMASLLNSTLLQQKFMNGGGGGGGMKGGGDPFHGMGLLGNNSEGGNIGMVGSKEVKVEGLQNRLDQWNNNDNNQMENMGISDPSLYWNSNNIATATTAWSDQVPNIGPSVTSLI